MLVLNRGFAQSMLDPHIMDSVPDSCDKAFEDGVSAETQMSLVTGRAILYLGHPTFGAVQGTRCILSLFGRRLLPPARRKNILWSNEMASAGLWAILTVNPQEWFEGAMKAKPVWIDQWLRDVADGVGQARANGHCVKPDQYAQARQALVGLVLKDKKAEDLRVRLMKVLSTLHCRRLD